MKAKFRKLDNGKYIELILKPGMSVGEVKELIRSSQGYDDGEIQLLFKTKPLNNDQKIDELGVTPNDHFLYNKKKSKTHQKNSPQQIIKKCLNEMPSEIDIQRVIEITEVNKSIAEDALIKYGLDVEVAINHILNGSFDNPSFKRDKNIPSEEDIQTIIECTGVERSLAEAVLIRYNLNIEFAINHILNGDINEMNKNYNINKQTQQITSQNDQPLYRRDENIPSEEDIQNVIEYTGVERSLAEAALMRYNLNIEVAINHILNGDKNKLLTINRNNQ